MPSAVAQRRGRGFSRCGSARHRTRPSGSKCSKLLLRGSLARIECDNRWWIAGYLPIMLANSAGEISPPNLSKNLHAERCL